MSDLSGRKLLSREGARYRGGNSRKAPQMRDREGEPSRSGVPRRVWTNLGRAALKGKCPGWCELSNGSARPGPVFADVAIPRRRNAGNERQWSQGQDTGRATRTARSFTAGMARRRKNNIYANPRTDPHSTKRDTYG